MIYEEPQPITREQAEAAVISGSPDEAAQALISVALHEQDRNWAESLCLRGLKDPREEVVAAAITGFGHLARLHRKVSPAVVRRFADFTETSL